MAGYEIHASEQIRLDGIIEGLRKPHRVLFVGDSGCGKSFTINNMLMLTAVNPATYTSAEYQSARQELLGTNPGLSHPLEALQSDPSSNPIITVISEKDADAIRDCGKYHTDLPQLMSSVSNWVHSNGNKHQSSAFLLPSMKQSGTTTPYLVTIKGGLTWHFQYKVEALSRAQDMLLEHVLELIKVSHILIILRLC